jgi:hypothetical protein
LLLVALFVVCNLAVFALNLRAGRTPSYTAAVRAVLGLTAFFVLPRVLPDPLLSFGVLLALLLWESVAWMQQRRNPGERPGSVTAPTNH